MSELASWGRKWWPGLIPLGLLWAAALWTGTIPLETNLIARSTASLEDTVLDKVVIEAKGRDIRLSAEAFSEAGRRSAIAQIETVPGLRVVNDATRLVPEAKPYVWSAERDVVRVTLGGNAPLPAIKSKLFEAARAAAGGEVVDRMALSRGAPPRFEAAVLLLIDQIGKLKDGKVVLSDNNVSLSGMARDLGGREAVLAALRNLPEGFSVAENAIKAPPYVFQANKDPVTATVTLSGYVPDNNVHAQLAAAASRKFFNEKVTDNLKASVGAPQGFSAAAVPALGALSRLSTGSLVMSDREIRLSGDALFAVAAEQIRASLVTEAPKDWRVTSDISVKPSASPVDATVCQRLLSELLAKGTIRFVSGRATIDQDSMGLLDRLIETALRCPTANIEVAGHTDSDGDAAANLALSERRAQSVVDYLSKAGVPPDRVRAVGYGSTQPVAANETDENKARNRRIDFVVK